MKNRLTKATTFEFEAALFGAVFGSLGAGVLLARYVSQTAALLLLILGIALHAWGMYRMNRRNS